jgi:nickel/cobalt exporter
MRRALTAPLAMAAFAFPAAASAHPLGNFSVNHLTQVSFAPGQVRLHWILDEAEIPTFQERGLADSAVLARKLAEARRGLHVSAGSRSAPLTLRPGARITHPPGQGGLSLTRVEADLSARVPVRARVEVRDDTFPGRVGWKAIQARPGRGTDVHATAPSADPTGGLRAYPKDALSSPADVRAATFRVQPGDGRLTAPHGAGASAATTTNRSGDGLAGVFARASAGQGVLLLLVLAAFAWGALHALAPGHGKAMVAAYLVGTRGTPRHAVALGATVTVAHTVGVFALGLVTLALSAYVLPEQLYPWLNLASGVLVLAIGAAVLRRRVRARRAARHPHHHHHHGHDHEHDAISWRGILAMGASAGLLPCPSALVVLLAGIAEHRVGLGLLLIAAFSLGLACTLTVLGLAVVGARRVAVRMPSAGGVVAVLPSASALVIVAVGGVLTIRALAGLP